MKGSKAEASRGMKVGRPTTE